MNFEQWNGRIDAKARAITQTADDADWTAVNALVAEFTELLKAQQADPDPRIRKVFERAQDLIKHVLDAARGARESARMEIQQIARGRKAIAAYR